jgi:hypothetical protein
MLEQRAKLESKISEADKQVIAEFRIEFEKKKAEAEARFEEMKQKHENSEAVDFRGMHKKGMKWVHGENFEKMKNLVEKYKDDIQPLFSEVADQQEKWKKEIKEIVKNTLELDDEEIEQGMKRMRHFHSDRIEMMKMGRFLLLDPNEEINTNSVQSLIKKVTAFPNPANSATTVEYDVLEDGQVLIELRDQKGNLLKTIENDFRAKGNHSVTISLENYKNDLFYIVITDKNGIATTKNIVRVR